MAVIASAAAAPLGAASTVTAKSTSKVAAKVLPKATVRVKRKKVMPKGRKNVTAVAAAATVTMNNGVSPEVFAVVRLGKAQPGMQAQQFNAASL